MTARDDDRPPAWLMRELVVWRGAAIVSLLILSIVLYVNHRRELDLWAIDSNRHASEEKARAEHWTRQELGLKTNGENIIRLDDALRACLTCHAHEDLDTLIGRARARKFEPKGRQKW